MHTAATGGRLVLSLTTSLSQIRHGQLERPEEKKRQAILELAL